MSGRSPNKRGRKKKSNKGRKPKKPLSQEEIAAKKNQKNMRETCRRVEINLHYELLYHSLGQNLVYNRAERVQLLRKAITKMAELKAQVTSLTDQIRATGITPHQSPSFQLNDSQKLFMLVQRWARNDNGKKCSRAKLKPVGIEIIDNNQNVPITVPCDGRIIRDHLSSDDNDHIPFWASWATDTYIVVDQDAFEKACSQAIIAGWDGKLGTKGAYYQPGLPQTCGLTIATSVNNNNNNNKFNDSDSDDNGNTNSHSHTHGHYHAHRNNMNNISMPIFPPRVDFPEIVVQNLESHIHPIGDMTVSTNTMTDNDSSEPPIKKQKLNNHNHNHTKKLYNNYNQLINMPLNVPFPSVGTINSIHPMNVLNGLNNSNSPFNMNNNTPENGQSTSSDTQSYNNSQVKSEPNTNNSPPQPQPGRVQLPQFLGSVNTFPPVPQLTSNQYRTVSTYPIYSHPIINNNTCSENDNIMIKKSPNNSVNNNNGICSSISTSINNNNKENISANTPPPTIHNKLNDLCQSPSGSSRNSVVFTPANHKNQATISTSSTPEQITNNKSPRPHKPSIHLPDNTSIDNYVNQLNWNNNNTQSDEYNNFDVIANHGIGINPINNMINEIAGNGYSDGVNANNASVDDGNGMKGSVFYG